MESALKPGSRVVAAMSGGVDSSVTAALLRKQGYEVIGITLQLYPSSSQPARKGACCAGADIADARRVAARLGIAHYVLDYEARFRESVVKDFADTYARGETPIPCVRCNQKVKFADLLGTARQLGAAAMATGWCANPSPTTEAAVALCEMRRVGRRPSRSVMTPPPTEEMTPPRPWRAATRPA